MADNISAELVDGAATVWYPIDQGLISWAFDPSAATGTYTLATAGTLYTVDLKVNPTTITNVVYRMTTAGAALTANQCFVGLYQNGVLLQTSASTATAWAGATGLLTTPLANPQLVVGGLITVAFVFNGTTGLTVASGSTHGNEGQAATVSRYATANTGVTTALPATLGAKSALAQTPWVAVS